VTRNPVFQFVLWSFLLSHPAFAQDAIQIEIDSAPVEIELKKPPEPVVPAQPAPPPQAETTPEDDDKQQVAEEGESKGMGKYGVAIGIGALVAGVLAALGGGGGGGGGGSSTPQH
jgi:hypothetical protein